MRELKNLNASCCLGFLSFLNLPFLQCRLFRGCFFLRNYAHQGMNISSGLLHTSFHFSSPVCVCVCICMCPHACILTLPGVYISLLYTLSSRVCSQDFKLVNSTHFLHMTQIFWKKEEKKTKNIKSVLIKQNPRASVHVCNNVNHCVSRGSRWKTLATRL